MTLGDAPRASTAFGTDSPDRLFPELSPKVQTDKLYRSPFFYGDGYGDGGGDGWGDGYGEGGG